MSHYLSEDEIEALLKTFGEPVEAPKPITRKSSSTRVARRVTSLSDIARENMSVSRPKKVVKDPDYLHVTEVGGEKYYSSPGSTVLHPEAHARRIFDFSKIRGFIRST